MSPEWRRELESRGFEGFQSVSKLRTDGLASVPDRPGVYMVLTNASSPPRFLARNPAAHHKGRDPSLPVEELRLAWVPGALVLYIGKAGGGATRSTLRSRLRAYLAQGTGRHAGHWGGRAIWQLADSKDLLLTWRVEDTRLPREIERHLIAEFERSFGARPFANRSR